MEFSTAENVSSKLTELLLTSIAIALYQIPYKAMDKIEYLPFTTASYFSRDNLSSHSQWETKLINYSTTMLRRASQLAVQR